MQVLATVGTTTATASGIIYTTPLGSAVEVERVQLDRSSFTPYSNSTPNAFTLVANSILHGSGSHLNPSDNTTRGEVAIMPQRFVELGRI